jgi:hypothetical protein
MTEDEIIKARLYDKCEEYLRDRFTTIQNAIKEARESANDDSKSSAGDKHETGRSMAQLEQEKLSAQLLETERLLNILHKVPRGKTSTSIGSGSLVCTDKGAYFISISAGKITLDGQNYMAVSPISPIGAMLLKSENSRAFNLNGQSYRIIKVC